MTEMFSLARGEKVAGLFAESGDPVVLVTRNGVAKRLDADSLRSLRSGSSAINLKGDDRLASAFRDTRHIIRHVQDARGGAPSLLSRRSVAPDEGVAFSGVAASWEGGSPRTRACWPALLDRGGEAGRPGRTPSAVLDGSA